jgi:hypothetical protein
MAFEPLPLWAWHAKRGLTCEAPQHEPAHGHVDHRFTAPWEVLILLTQAAIAADPGDRPFHHPPAGQDREAGAGRRFDIASDQHPPRGWLHELQGPPPGRGQPYAQRVTAAGHVGPNPFQLRVRGKRRGEEPWRRGRLAQIGGVDQDTQEETRRINEEMALAPADLLGPIIAMRPPFSVVFTDWASRMAADG